jgi:tellurite resistance protein TerC
MAYYTGFMIEKSLSMDNVFAIALIFSFFAIPRQYQHRVLFWDILGVIVLRAIMIGLGATLVSQFSWILYLFGAFLIFKGIKMWIIADHLPDIENNPLLKLLKKHMRVTEGLRGTAWVSQPDPGTGKVVRFATPMLLALVLIELRTWCSLWTRCRPSLPSPPTRSSSVAATSSPSWGCVSCTSRWRR